MAHSKQEFMVGGGGWILNWTYQLAYCLLFALAGVGLCCEQPISFTRFRPTSKRRPASGTLIFIIQYVSFFVIIT